MLPFLAMAIIGGVMMVDDRLVILGVTPSAGGNYSFDCRNWDNSHHCYYWSQWSTGMRDAVFIVGVPTPYPTAIIAGRVYEALNNSCYPNISTNYLNIGLTPNNPTGITTNCGITPALPEQPTTSYSCSIIFDNQNSNPVPEQIFTLSVDNLDYSPVYWTEDNSCLGTQTMTANINVSSSNSGDYIKNKDLFFSHNQAWIKLKNSSFVSNKSLDNFIPFNISAYDSEDNGLRYFIIGEEGVVSSGSTINTGTAAISSKNWVIRNYNSSLSFYNLPTDFLEYLRARRNYIKVVNLNELLDKKINVSENNFTIDSNNKVYFDNKNLVFVVNGEVTINT